MSTGKISLSEQAIGALPTPPQGKNRIYRFANHPNLAIRVTSNGRRHFIYCYMSDALDSRGMRVEQRTSLKLEWVKGGGTCLAVRAVLEELGGKPPESRSQRSTRLRSEKQQSARDMTIGRLIDRYITEHAKPKKRSWQEDDTRLNTHVRPVWGDRKAKDITRADVDALVSPVAVGDESQGIRPRPAEANHRLAVVRKMFSFALDKGIIDSHPCLRMAAPGGKIAARERALTTAKELRLLWRITEPNSPWTKPKRKGWSRYVAWEARGRMSETIADALRLVLATGARASEVCGLRWDEIDLDAGTWLLPRERSKNKRPHLLPLLPETVEMLARRRGEVTGDYVFPGQFAATKHINDKHMSEALRNACTRLAGLGLVPFTTHDLRRTVETGMAAAKVPKEYRDKVLNHVDASVGGKHYNVHDYYDEKRESLEKWARRVETMLRPATSTVVPIRRSKR